MLMRGQLSLSRQAKEKGHQVRAMGVLSAVEHIVNETAMQARTPASNRQAKAHRARVKQRKLVSHVLKTGNQRQARKLKNQRKWDMFVPLTRRGFKSKENKGKSKGTKSSNQGAKDVHKGKTSKAGLSGLEHSKSEASSDIQESAQTCPTDNSWIHDEWRPCECNDGWSFDEWNDDWSSVGWHEDCEQSV